MAAAEKRVHLAAALPFNAATKEYDTSVLLNGTALVVPACATEGLKPRLTLVLGEVTCSRCRMLVIRTTGKYPAQHA